MIIDDLHVVRVTILPAEAHAPLIIDANAMLSRPIAPELLEPIPRRHAEILELFRSVEHDELPEHRAMQIARKATDPFPREQALRVAIGEALDHPEP